MKLKEGIIWIFYGLSFGVALYLVIVFSVWLAYEGKFLPGISIAGVSVSGLNQKEAEKKISEATQNFLKKDLAINVGGKKIKPSDLELSFAISETIEAIKAKDTRTFNLWKKENHPLKVDYNKDELLRVLRALDEETRSAVRNPSFANNDFKIIPGEKGKRIIYGEVANRFQVQLGHLRTAVDVEVFEVNPTYSEKELAQILPNIKGKLERGISLIGPEEVFFVGTEELTQWVSLEKSSSKMAINTLIPGSRKKVVDKEYFSRTKIENYLKEISEEINTEPRNAKLGVEGGRVIIREEDQKGRLVDVEESAKEILQALRSSERMVVLKIKPKEAKINSRSLARLGLKDLVATGYSDFSGSPQNRRHNIRIGAERFDGMVLDPGEVFSFVGKMGEISARSGYLPELVIINNETRFEYGGGLCQVSTTVFRAALNAGFPIIERRAHAYPVIYYRPFGADAAIYSPRPDLRFKNNTSGYLLIQTRIEGNNLYFDFFGTKKEIDVRFAGNKNAIGAVSAVEEVVPFTYDHGKRGPGSFKAVIYRFIHDSAGRLLGVDEIFSNYGSPDRFPRRPAN